MAPSFDVAASILLCAEDNSSILGLDGEEEEEEMAAGPIGQRPICGVVGGKRSGYFVDSFMDFPLQSDQCIAQLVDKEGSHLPRGDYAERLRSGGLDLRVRGDAIDWIWKVCAYYNFAPLTACLAVNYLDRFLSLYVLPEGKAWMTQLLSVACLSLAAKMEETVVPLCLDLQVGDARYVFEAKTIQRMELLVLNTLKWRMQAVTPFSFINYFLHQLNGGSVPSKLLVSQSVELILCMARGTDGLGFRPSETAAAVAVTVLGEAQDVDIEKAISRCINVEKERVLRCHEVILSMPLMSIVPPKIANPRASSSVPQSPIGVLDAASLSDKSDETTVGQHAICYDGSPATSKKRKIS